MASSTRTTHSREPRDVVVQSSVTRAQDEALRKLARDADRSISWQVGQAIKDHLAKHAPDSNPR
jgi:uncharacterized protein YaeQ